jgi:hypothetical protein
MFFFLVVNGACGAHMSAIEGFHREQGTRVVGDTVCWQFKISKKTLNVREVI